MTSVKEQIPAVLMPATAYHSSASDFFAKQVVNDAWESSSFKEYGPVNVIEDEKICFSIPKLDSSTFMYLGEAKFSMQLSLEDKDGKPPPTLDSDGKFEAELEVRIGRGYCPAEGNKKDEQEIGVIPQVAECCEGLGKLGLPPPERRCWARQRRGSSGS